MELLSDWRAIPSALRGGVLCIGNFDGVHLGHARMLSTGRDQARARRQPFAIMTFDPHPNVLLKPGVPRLPLTTLEQRVDLLAAFSPDLLLIVPTTPDFLAISAAEFLEKIVAAATGLGASLLVEGPTFTYGRSAAGTIETLRQTAPALGLDTLIVPTLEQSLTDLSLVNVSSTVIRWLIAQGRVADAGRALGRPHTLRGTVVEGARRGRKIGFPTANLQSSQLIPAPGVYAGTATFAPPSPVSPHAPPSAIPPTTPHNTHPAAISVGTNPTFEGTQTTVEAHLLDFSADLYGKTLDLAFHRWLREMLPFAGPGPLVAQMQRDAAQARRQLAALQ